MSSDEFEKYEKRIHSQFNKIGIPSNLELAYTNLKVKYSFGEQWVMVKFAVSPIQWKAKN